MPKPRGEEGGLSGLSREEMVGSAFRVFVNAQKGTIPGPSWGELDEAKQEGWDQAVRRQIEVIESSEEGRASLWAEEMYRNFAEASGEEPLAFDSLALSTRLGYEATVRHLVNILGGYNPAEDGDLAGHEATWEEWGKTQFDKRSGE